MDTADKLAIYELLSLTACAYDDHDIDTLARCFTADASMIIHIAGHDSVGPFNGHGAIIDLMKSSMASQTDTRRHVISNIYFASAEAETAKVVSNLTLFSVVNGTLRLVATGIYRDTVTGANGRWKISVRELSLDLPYA